MPHIPQGLAPYFKALSILGVLLVIGDTWLSTKFGYSIAVEMAIIYAAISVASGVLLVIAWYFRRLGNRALSNGLAAAWCVAFVFNCWSNMGVSTSNRMGEVQQATVQQTRYQSAKKAVADGETNLAMWRKRLSDLEAQNAWATTQTADALRARLASAELAIVQEAKRGGCGPRCLARTQERDELQSKIALAEERGNLTKQIKATEAILAKHRETASATDAGISNTANQSTLYAKLISWNLAANPDEAMVVVANEATGIGSAFVLALLATAVTFASAWPHLASVGPMALTSATMATSYPAPQAPTHHVAAAPHVQTVQPVEVSVPVTVRHEVQAEPAPLQVAEPVQAFHPINRVVRVRDTAFARRVAHIAQRHQTAAA